MIPELHKTLQLSQDQVCVLAALLGNFLLPESELQDLYRRVIPNSKDNSEVSFLFNFIAQTNTPYFYDEF